jgi:hypothetical protein
MSKFASALLLLLVLVAAGIPVSYGFGFKTGQIYYSTHDKKLPDIIVVGGADCSFLLPPGDYGGLMGIGKISEDQP